LNRRREGDRGVSDDWVSVQDDVVWKYCRREQDEWYSLKSETHCFLLFFQVASLVWVTCPAHVYYLFLMKHILCLLLAHIRSVSCFQACDTCSTLVGSFRSLSWQWMAHLRLN
jgi:hypothetical protein